MPSIPGVAGNKARIYVDGIDLSCQSSGATLVSDVEPLEYQPMCSPTKKSEPSSPKFTITQNAYYTGHGAEYVEQEMKARLGALLSHVVLQLDTVYYALEDVYNGSMTIDANVSDLLTIEANWQGASKGYRGKVVGNGSRSNAYVGTAVDFGAAIPAGTAILSAAGFTDLTGVSGSVTVLIETATTQGGTYTTLTSQAFIMPGSVIKTHTGGNRWARIKVTTTNYAGAADVFGGITLQVS